MLTQEGLEALRAFRERLHEQLMKSPEYRAIAVIDRTIEEISGIYGPAPAERERATAAPVKETAASAAPAAPAPISEAAHTRIAKAIADAIESNVAQLRSPRAPQPAPYALLSAAS